ncbi:MAG: ATP-dependent RecD-like DNA helicase, partial [candidate division NC10 bacterium]|nr:ATP-dependent RecD-like DNA helicase [candidate division NC10 bacterium]
MKESSELLPPEITIPSDKKAKAKRSRRAEEKKPPSYLEGVVERIVYANEETGYAVLRLQAPGRRDWATVVGNLPSVNCGETLRLAGQWSFHPQFGEQFKAEAYQSVIPATLNGIEKYLGSGLIKGIGPIMASRIVRAFGLKTLEVIDHEPRRLLEVEGIGEIRLEWILAAWQAQKEIREVMLFLQGQGVSPAYSARIYKHYGQESISVLKKDPYRLAEDITGIGFKTADKIAQKMGIEPTSPLRAQAGILYTLRELADEGHVFFPAEELLKRAEKSLEIPREILEPALSVLEQEKRVMVNRGEAGDEVYLPAFYRAEEGVAKKLFTLLQGKRRRAEEVLSSDFLSQLEGRMGITLAERQKEALKLALQQRILIITGGPGTGKTTIVKGIVSACDALGMEVCLAAPTGRAAKRLSEATEREAKTIHRLLEFSPAKANFVRDQDHPLQADLLVIDETSMVDLILMNHLLKAVPSHASLVFVGDVHQLPSVGAGSVLADMIQSQAVSVIELNEIFRQARTSLITVNAHRIQQGMFPYLPKGKDEVADFYFIEKEEPQEILELIQDLCVRRIPERFGFHPRDEIQVLCPMHKGLVGAANLNATLQGLLNPNGAELGSGSRIFRVRDKVMQIRNNYEKEVFNGDIGWIEKIDREEGEVIVRFEDRSVAYDFSEMDELTLAYAISVHKSQGSEYPAIIMPLLMQHFVLLQRNLLYTAITR